MTDESRFGLMSIVRRCLTARGVKPLIPYQHRFSNFYLFGAYSPVNGASFTLELPYCNSSCFSTYLEQMSAYNPSEFKVLILDNGAFHKAKELVVPTNIALLFLPPYSPELNGAEQIWRYIKDRLANKIWKTLSDLSDAVAQIIKNMTAQTIESIVGWELYKNAYKECLNL